jgi:SAM-dependent methyltransferase
MPEPSKQDVEHLTVIRASVRELMRQAAATYVVTEPQVLLDIAPQNHEGAAPYFPASVSIETIDIDPSSGCTFIADICANNDGLIPSARYDFVVCTEVLEHTLHPFDAVTEITRVLKPRGHLFLSTPFNFRIHGPLPDCWRFTEHGLRALLRDFEIIELDTVETPSRPLMPIHHRVIARRPAVDVG